MVKVYMFGLVEIFMKVSGRMMIGTVMVNLLGLMAKLMKVSGLKI